MTLLAIPLCMLYFASGLFALLIDRRRNKTTDLDTNASPIDTPEEI
jgi:sec-independent protein translocase protein TatC